MDEKTRALYAQFRAEGSRARDALRAARDKLTRPEIAWDYDGTGTFESEGLSFKVEVERDDFGDKPWDHNDLGDFIAQGRLSRNSHGVEKSCSDIVLSYDRHWGTTFDFRGAVRYLRKHGSSGEEANRCALSMAEYFRRWLNNQWHYVTVFVTLLDVDGNKTDEYECVGGYESDARDMHEETAIDLARQIAARVGDAKALIRVKKMQIRDNHAE